MKLMWISISSLPKLGAEFEWSCRVTVVSHFQDGSSAEKPIMWGICSVSA